MSKSKLLARLHCVMNREPLAVWLVVLAFVINVFAWVVPRGSYQNPEHDPLHAGFHMARLVSHAEGLHYFWHAIIVLTFATGAYAAFRIWTLTMTHIVDRVDL
ncbi:MAG: hypothetical protein H7249_04415 [Chitinophagaceae bacterium]|nr:hypothetical protein [Oligoflexus sp.]